MAVVLAHIVRLKVDVRYCEPMITSACKTCRSLRKLRFFDSFMYNAENVMEHEIE